MQYQILFHQLKHHLGYLKEWIIANKGDTGYEVMRTIKTLGSSQLDMYCGELTVDDITGQVVVFLQKAGINDAKKLKQWLGDEYKLITLSDGSSFTIHYVSGVKPAHIHPSRYAVHTIRLKANALKTAVCLLLSNAGEERVNMRKLNALRMEHLQLPPIADKQDISEVFKALNLVKTHYSPPS